MTFERALTIAKGNKEAAVWLCDYDSFCSLMDDIIDEPGSIKDVVLASGMLNIIGNFAVPGWVRDNSPRLYPLIVTGANAWLDANAMAKSDDYRTQLSSDVLKSQYAEMENAVAFLCGGFDHMRAMSAERKFDYDIPLKEGK